MSDEASASPADRQALVALYNAANGADWENGNNWLSDRPHGEWHGANIDGEGRVILVHLFDNRLSGTIPAELADLTRLQVLDLSRNRLSGSIPPALGNLTRLQVLRLDGNQLSGCVPSGLQSQLFMVYPNLGGLP